MMRLIQRRRNGERVRPLARVTPLHALLAAAVLGLVAMPLAFAGAAGGPKATTSVVTDAKFKKLKKRIAALEGKQDSTRPSGPAGGDLAGTYPNPTIGPNAVSSNEVALDSLTAVDIAPDAIGASETASNSVGTSEVVDGSLGGVDLKNTFSVASAGEAVAAGADASETASCGGHRLLGGGYAWLNNADGVEMHSNAPSGVAGDNPTAWLAAGETNVDNTLFAWAVCLRV